MDERAAAASDTTAVANDEAGAAPSDTPAPVARTELQSPGGYREVLAIPAFRRLWLIQSVAALGEALASVATPLLAYGVTGSEELVGLIFVVTLAPRVVLAPLTGVLADRVDRRRLMLGADLSRAGLVALLPFADTAGQIAAVAALVAIAGAVSRPAELAALPAVVGPGQLVQALSLSQVTTAVVRVVGPAAGAALIGVAGPGPAFGAQAILFLVSSALLWRLALPAIERAADGAVGLATAARRQMAEGLRVVWTNRIVRGTAAVEALWQVLTAVILVTMVVYVERTLALGERSGAVYALVVAMASLGAALGALMAGRMERRIGRGRLMAIGYLAPLVVVPVALTPPLPVLFACWFAMGFADAWAVIGMQAYLAESVPDALRGRVYATWGAVVNLGGAIGFAAVGWVTPRLGPPATVAAVGLLVGIGGPLLLVATGAIAAIRRDREAATVVAGGPA